MEKKLKISGMHCMSCEKLVRMAVEESPGVMVVSISHKTGDAVISINDEKNFASVKKAIEAEGYKVQ